MTTTDPRIDVQELKGLLPDSCSGITVLDRGKRGVVFKAEYNDSPVAIKVSNPVSKAMNRISHEAKTLEKVNACGIGPKLETFTDDYVIMEYLEGRRIEDFILDDLTTSEQLRTVLQSILDQLFILDTINLNKQEMTRPYKHIIVSGDLKPVLIDFERTKYSLRPANITQFAQYLTSSTISARLQRKGLLPDKALFLETISEYQRVAGKTPAKTVFSRLLELI